MEVNFSIANSFLRPFCGKSCKMAFKWLSDLLSPVLVREANVHVVSEVD
jgi:hypothetical protein